MNREIQCSQDENPCHDSLHCGLQTSTYDQRSPIRIRFVSSCFSVCSAGRELRRVLFGENLPHFATLAIRAALGLVNASNDLFTGLREPTPPFALNFWRAGGGGFELRGSRRLWRKLLRAFYI
jgi:hypothetical protein